MTLDGVNMAIRMTEWRFVLPPAGVCQRARWWAVVVVLYVPFHRFYIIAQKTSPLSRPKKNSLVVYLNFSLFDNYLIIRILNLYVCLNINMIRFSKYLHTWIDGHDWGGM